MIRFSSHLSRYRHCRCTFLLFQRQYRIVYQSVPLIRLTVPMIMSEIPMLIMQLLFQSPQIVRQQIRGTGASRPGIDPVLQRAGTTVCDHIIYLVVISFQIAQALLQFSLCRQLLGPPAFLKDPVGKIIPVCPALLFCEIHRLTIQNSSLNVMGRCPSKGKKDLPSISKTCPRSNNITLSRIMCRTFPPCHSSSGYSPIIS